MRIILGGMGGMMGKTEIRKMIKTYCEKMAVREFQDDNLRDSFEYENLKIECQQREEVIKRRYVQRKTKEKEKRWNIFLNKNFGLNENFDLSKYECKEVMLFLFFYENCILENPNDILRHDRAIGEKRPNQKIMSYTQKYQLGHDYEKFYDYVLNCRNYFMKDEGVFTISTLDSCGIISAYFDEMVIKINIISNKNMEWMKKLRHGMHFLLYELSGCIECTKKDNINYWMIFSICEIIQDGLLEIITVAMQETNGKAYLNLSNMLDGVLKDIETILQVKKRPNKFAKDIFQDYAIEYIFCAESKECEIVDNVLEKLAQIGEIKEKKDRRQTHEKKARDLGEYLENRLGILINLNDRTQIESIIDEIFFRDREMCINIGGKKKNYKMPGLVNNLLNEKNIRSEETIIISHKIKRGIDCCCYGGEFYKNKNEIFRKVYNIKRIIYDFRKRDTDYIRRLPYYIQKEIWVMLKYLR